MTTANQTNLVSVIIPCYNHGRYLANAIESVQRQSHRSYEIIVVDDGSTDNTKDVAESHDTVRYVYQHNQGLSAARNVGIGSSRGEFLVFLDADDWFFPDAFATNIKYLQDSPELAFVSGGHRKVSNTGRVLEEHNYFVEDHHYQHLLQGNYIGMHATVMYRRWVFNTFCYDTSLAACEDYDLYLKITRKYPVVHHQEIVAAYRIHNSNMSGDIPLMLNSVLLVLARQHGQLENNTEKECYARGLKIWKEYYGTALYEILLGKQSMVVKKRELATLRKYTPRLFVKILKAKFVMGIKKLLKRLLGKKFIPRQGKVRMGDFNTTQPFSTQFGYDRGGPVDRYYIENFLEQHAQLITGNVLEIGDNEYTLRYGGNKITKSDILHVDKSNPKATYIGDLTDVPDVPDNKFDCIILTQTLHLIYNFKQALQTCYRVLKPGGVLLLTVPGISHIDEGEWKNTWLWSFTGTSISKVLSEIFPEQDTKVETFGNVLVATAFLYGMGLPEMTKKQMDFVDPQYQVIVTARAIKS